MKRLIGVFLTTLLVLSMCSCGNSVAKEAAAQGKKEMANKEYEKAAASFKLAIDNGNKDADVSKLEGIMNEYLVAKKDFDSNDIDGAKKEISKISEEYIHYPIKDDIDNLKKSINDKEKANKESENKKEAENKKESSKQTSNTSGQKAKYMDKLRATEVRAENLNKDAETTAAMNEAANKEYKMWDDNLNEIYGVLKTQLSSSEMDSLRQKQREWIKYRDKKAKDDSAEYEGGSIQPLMSITSLSGTTKDRCYELVQEYMK